jgi:hypothetical protein
MLEAPIRRTMDKALVLSKSRRIIASRKTTLRALSIRPPWAWAIAHAGKRIENRSWSTKYRGPLVIHSSLRLLPADVERLENILGRRVNQNSFSRGAIVATATLADVLSLDHCSSRWAFGPYCWVLRDIRPLANPIYVTGALQLWYPRSRCTRSQMAALSKHLSLHGRKTLLRQRS